MKQGKMIGRKHRATLWFTLTLVTTSLHAAPFRLLAIGDSLSEEYRFETPIPAGNIQTLPNGTVNLIPSAPKLFYKFAATPKP